MADQTVPELSKRYPTPQHWQDTTKYVETILVEKATQEFTALEGELKLTLPRATMTTILRVQNSWLWERYAFNRERIALKNEGMLNERDLFHGTGGINPSIICKGEEGLDMRFSRDGLWGRANYFTECAEYANRYAHVKHTMNGMERELLLVRVTLGNIKDLGTSVNCQLRMPPPLPSATHHLDILNPQYDSISGITQNTRVYMTYDNWKSYPAYILSYTLPSN